MTQNKKGFTLIELMVVMAIIAVLAVLMVGAIQLARNTATETTHRSNAKSIQTALEGNYAKYKRYCGTATGEIACNTAVSFATAAGSTGLNLTLGSSSCPATGSGSGAAGGGRITTITEKTYIIAPANSACGGFTDVSDVIYSGVSKPDTLPNWVSS